MSYKTDAYLITCLTNMHVGSGEANYGVVDNLVQRDPITEIPVIHSSSLKGALREFFKEVWAENPPKLNHVFGADTSRDHEAESGIGHYKFFDANLIVLPVRSNKQPFYSSTSDYVLKEINNKADLLNISLDVNPFDTIEITESTPRVADNLNPVLEDYQAANGLVLKAGARNHIGDNPALFYQNDFKELCKHLPVIARNHLENGQSKNLFYEEVVPRESRFVFFISKDEEYRDDFDCLINQKIIQIGGNASIGYGYTKIEKIS